MAPVRDPVRANIRTTHASFVMMFLLMFVIFGLGAFETLAAIVNPKASLLLELAEARTRAAQSGGSAVHELPWITVTRPTQVFSAMMDPLRIAQPGERYQVTSTENGWALAVRQGDPPDRAIWIALDDRVQAPGLVPSPGTEALTLSAIVAAALLLTIGLYFGIRRRLRPRGPRRRASGRGEAASGATKEPTSGVPTAT